MPIWRTWIISKNYSKTQSFIIINDDNLDLPVGAFAGFPNLTSLSVDHAIPVFSTGTGVPLNVKFNVSKKKDF